MKNTLVSLLVVMISMLGIADAGYVTFETFSNRIPVCRPPFECGAVLESKWAYIAGLPVSFYGLLFYSLVFVLAVVNFLELKIKLPVIKSARQGLKYLAVFGFMFSIYLVVLMGLVIQAWCLWCVISAINSTLLFIVTRFLNQEKPAVQPSFAEAN